MLLDPEPAPLGTLLGHVARSNPQWQRANSEMRALAIFRGPDAYVSPSWYETKRETGKVVPTWNYVAVHATGLLQFFDDPNRLLELVTKLTESREMSRSSPWSVSDAPAEYIAARLKGIVGFQLRIERIEGKWKMSQDRRAEDRAGVIDGLEHEGGEAELAVAAVMKGTGGL
jgi:transcriptional regulator